MALERPWCQKDAVVEVSIRGIGAPMTLQGVDVAAVCRGERSCRGCSENTAACDLKDRSRVAVAGGIEAETFEWGKPEVNVCGEARAQRSRLSRCVQSLPTEL